MHQSRKVTLKQGGGRKPGKTAAQTLHEGTKTHPIKRTKPSRGMRVKKHKSSSAKKQKMYRTDI